MLRRPKHSKIKVVAPKEEEERNTCHNRQKEKSRTTNRTKAGKPWGGERQQEGVTVKSRQTNDTSLTNEPSAVTENCHHACNKHRSGTKGIISSHQTFMHIPEHRTSHLHRQKETPSTTNRTKGGTSWTGKGPDEGVTASSR